VKAKQVCQENGSEKTNAPGGMAEVAISDRQDEEAVHYNFFISFFAVFG